MDATGAESKVSLISMLIAHKYVNLVREMHSWVNDHSVGFPSNLSRITHFVSATQQKMEVLSTH